MNLKEKVIEIRQKTIDIHKKSPETRIASSLSPLEILCVLYYNKILSFDSKNPNWEYRDRLIISKAHGAISLYPILADLGFFRIKDLDRVCKENSIFGSIPDCNTPGIETINGSLGHGLGIACGIAIGLKKKHNNSNVFVLMGDGELWEGSVWEAVMFAGFHGLGNLILIIDRNKISMLDYTKNILDLEPLENKFKAFRWNVYTVNGHNTDQLFYMLEKIKDIKDDIPKVLIADTTKGRGTYLENDPLCHVKSLR